MALAAVFGAHGFRAGDYWATGLAGGFCASRTTGYRPALSRKALAAVFGAHWFRAGDYWATGLAGGFCASTTTGYRPEAKGLSPTFEDNQMGLRMTFAIPIHLVFIQTAQLQHITIAADVLRQCNGHS